MTTERWVAGNSLEKGGEDETDSNTGTTETNSSRSHSKVLRDLDHGGGDLRGVWASLNVAESLAGGGSDDGGLLTLHGLESGSLGHACK